MAGGALLYEKPLCSSSARPAIEQDLEKPTRWLGKIQARGFFPDERSAQAEEMLAGCRRALTGFSGGVYAAEGAQELADTGHEDTGRGSTA
jgi:hypothetical protein